MGQRDGGGGGRDEADAGEHMDVDAPAAASAPAVGAKRRACARLYLSVHLFITVVLPGLSAPRGAPPRLFMPSCIVTALLQ